MSYVQPRVVDLSLRARLCVFYLGKIQIALYAKFVIGQHGG